MSSPRILPQSYQSRPFFIVAPWTPDTDLVNNYIEEFLETKPWGDDGHPMPGHPKPTGPIKTVNQLIAQWHAHYEKFVHSLLPPGKKFMPNVLVEGEPTVLECAITDTPSEAPPKLARYTLRWRQTRMPRSTMRCSKHSTSSTPAGRSIVFTDPERASTAQPLSVWIRRWPAAMFGRRCYSGSRH